VHDGDGETLLYRNLALRLNAGRTVYGLQPVSGNGLATHHTRIPDLARHFVECMRRVQPEGPYLVGGLCAGGVIAFEVACQLQALGQSVAMTAMLDIGDVKAPVRRALEARERFKRFVGIFRNEENVPFALHFFNIAKRATRKVKGYLSYAHATRLEDSNVNERAMRLRECLDRGESPPEELKSLTVRQLYYFARNSYSPTGMLQGDLILFRATRGDGTVADTPVTEMYAEPDFGWSGRISGQVRAFDVPGGHSTMLQDPNVSDLAAQLQRELSRVA
jgi:thioesterase domain-containing protein